MNVQTIDPAIAKSAAQNYERFFVPAVGRPVATLLVADAKLQPGERVLDVACGTGVVARLASEQVGAGGSVAGVDPNPAMLAVARNSAPAGTEITWHQAPAEQMPVADESVDVVLCGQGLQFFGDRAAALGEMHRVLVDGGRFAANVPGPIPPPLHAMADLLNRHVGPEPAGFVGKVFSLHDEDELRELAEAGGFANVEVTATVVPVTLGAPADFLWGYIGSTPLAGFAAGLSDEGRTAIGEEYAAATARFVTDGKLNGRVRISTVTGVKA